LPVSELLARWSGREIVELGAEFMIQNEERDNPESDLDARARALAETL
jgi:hypothetical protein